MQPQLKDNVFCSHQVGMRRKQRRQKERQRGEPGKDNVFCPRRREGGGARFDVFNVREQNCERQHVVWGSGRTGILETSDWVRANCTQCQTAASLEMRTPNDRQTENQGAATGKQNTRHGVASTTLRRCGSSSCLGWIGVLARRYPDTATTGSCILGCGKRVAALLQRHALISDQNEEQQQETIDRKEVQSCWRKSQKREAGKATRCGRPWKRTRTHTTGVVTRGCGTRVVGAGKGNAAGKANLSRVSRCTPTYR